MIYAIPILLLCLCISILTHIVYRLWKHARKVEDNITTILGAYATHMHIIKILDKRIWALFNALQGTCINTEARDVLFRQFDDFVWELHKMAKDTENKPDNNNNQTNK